MVQPTIETVGQVAAEITRLYAAFDKAAANLTSEYIEQRLAGEEGVTWDMFPRSGFLRRPTPILDAIVRQEGAILLGAGYTMWNDLLNEYRLVKMALLVPGKDGTFVRTDAISVRRAKRGYNPGDEYIVVGDQILKAGYDHQGSAPTIGAHGGFAWSVPRDWVNDTFRPLAEVDPGLQRVVKALQSYEPDAQSE